MWRFFSTYRWSLVALGCFVASLTGYTWFSYSLTAPNLVLSTWQPYWQWQWWMWETFFHNRALLSQVFAVILVIIWLSYGWLLLPARSVLNHLWQRPAQKWLILGILVLPLLVSMNALSYDVFNYMFNAKMVVRYQANPHVKTALDFSDDPWVRFMHNTHTPAPYGYGWTVISLVPYTLGLDKLLPTWLAFRALSVLSWLCLGLVLAWLITALKQSSWWWWVVMLNPLILIEVIANQHNDLWMMVPAVASLGWLMVTAVTKQYRQRTWLIIICSGLLLLGSASIKLATIILLPIWLLLTLHILLPSHYWANGRQLLTKYWAVVAAGIMFLPLLSTRSQQFHPWYWTWVLVWIPLMPNRVEKRWLNNAASWWQLTILLTTGVLLWRYWPYLKAATFAGTVFSQQLLITWLGIGLAALLSLGWIIYSVIKYNKSL